MIKGKIKEDKGDMELKDGKGNKGRYGAE